MTLPPIQSIFVYGTLQQGEERATCWPRPPLLIAPATIRAELYDLGPYPAIVQGNDIIGGEVWQLAPADMAITLEVLDQIECYGQGGVDLYLRKQVQCHLVAGEALVAFTYYLQDEALARRQQRVLPGDDGACRWHRYR